ncbi:transcriptional regulator [Cenarchaeum symbiosum A]|uniref:Transcriptional regulator n=1 Tax=Cenarchaeum symbiosum (strain A) TaxID=414004 RepID=A0RUA8_CENSY|nr:transcriptional regulator [Cenarchaeum symbiosum A]
MPITFVLLNSDLGSDDSVIDSIREILEKEDAIEYEVLAVYGVYDVILKLTSADADKLRMVITNRIRRISKVQSTLTMMVIEEQGRS